MLKKGLLFSLVLVICLMAFANQPGPFVDSVYVNVRMQEEIGLKDAAQGMTDVFAYGVNGPTLFGLPEEDLEKLEIYNVPSGSWSLLLNNVPDKAPYQVEVDEQTYFNPFAIKEVRYALNFLINRQYIVDQILGGAGEPAFTMATPGQPGTEKYNDIVQEFGFVPEGNEEKAVKMIDDAMKAAAELPENKGRLVKKDGLWTFDGKTELAAIKFLIRVDDPNGRLIEGNYISDLLEGAGIPVERLYWDRSKTGTVVYGENPANYDWGMYTEGWGAGATRRWWSVSLCQMYAPFYGYMPGGANDTFWNYTNETLDDYAIKAYYGQYVTSDEYWEYSLEALKLGLEDSVRIYVCSQEDFFTANKDAFDQRFAYGLGDGVNEWSLITAKTKDNTLTVTEFSAQGGLFMSAWDPLGTDGFSDTYSNLLAAAMTDLGSFESPVTAVDTPNRAIWDIDSLETVVEKENGEIVGKLEVPADALTYNTMTKEWEKVGEGVTCQSKCTYDFIFSNYHNGNPQTINSLIYLRGLVYDWATEDGDNDMFFDSEYSSNMSPNIATEIAWTINDDGSITTYYDYNFPPDENRVASNGAPVFTALGGNPVSVSWDIYEALSQMVAVGSESGTPWNFRGRDPDEVDLLSETCVADIRAKLQEMYDNGHVPVYVKDYMTVEEAKAAYKASIDFIDTYGTAYISNGSFFIKEYDADSSYFEIAAFRDPTYPHSAQEWLDKFAVPRLVINSVGVPAYSVAGQDIVVSLDIAKVVYPSISQEDANEGKVILTLKAEEPIIVEADVANNGVFDIVIPGAKTEGLAAGSYQILVATEIEGGFPISQLSDIIIY